MTVPSSGPAAVPPSGALPSEPSPVPPSSAPLPAAIGPYRVVRLLGSGGMGRVYLAATRGGRAVAVKVVRESYAQDPHFRDRFRAEAEAALKVSGAFTAPVLAADTEAAQPWLATAYLPAPSLTDAVTAYGPMPERTVRDLAAGLAEALAAIHAAGLVHRDLKPSNILLTADGPRVIDFGITRAVEGAGLTGTGQLVGTAGYMPPEQISGRTCTSAADVFSLGATLVFAATGRGAFGASGLHILLYRTVHEAPDLTAVPEELREALARCLDKDPWNRPKVSQLAALFGAPVLPDAGWLPDPVEREVRRRQEADRAALDDAWAARWSRRRVLTVSGGAAAAAALGGGAYLIRRERSAGKAPRARLLHEARLPDGFSGVWTAARGRLLVNGKNAAGAAALDPAKLTPLWQRKAYASTPSATDGRTAYVVELDGAVYARDLVTGRKRWSFAPPGNPQPEFTDLTVRAGDDGWAYVTSNATGRLYAVDSGGTRRWDREAALTAVYPRGRTLLCVARKQSGADGRRTVYALDAHSGKKLWDYDSEVFGIGGDPGTRLAVALRHDTAELVGLRLSDGDERWRTDSGLDPGDGIQNESLAASVLISPDGRTVVTDLSLAKGSVAGLDADSGTSLWPARVEAATKQQLTPIGQTLFTTAAAPVGTDPTAGNGPLAAHGLRDGGRRWQTPDLGKGLHQVLWAGSGTVVLGVSGGSDPGLYGYATADGRKLWYRHYENDPLVRPWTAVSSGNRVWMSSASTVLAFEFSRS
ncbi:protein kinase [Streptomyces sp. NPDC058221]|uniref:protein kinase domain-containing protein n=1 Tax=Streptomyces sp. NPDC058221 TaxID=3346388 RepID=UPI0036EA5230